MKLLGCNVLRIGGCNPLLFRQFLHFLCLRNLLYHLHTASQSLVKILCGQSGGCLLALGCLQLMINLLQYAITLRSSFNLANLRVMSSGCYWSAQCTFLTSRCSVGVLTSVADQLNGSFVSHCGPFHHSVDVDKVAGSTPFEMKSAGLDWDSTCLHVAEAVSSWMMATLLPTDIFHLFDGPCIHVSTMEESVQR
jgi:hypothetical protein